MQIIQVYRNTIDFNIFILPSATLINWLFGFFLVNFLQHSIYQSISSVNIVVLLYQSGCLFSSLIFLTRACNTTFNKTGDSKHPCPVPDVRREAFNLSPLSMSLAVGVYLVDILYEVEELHSINDLLDIFIIKKVLNLSLSYAYWDVACILLYSFDMMYYIIWFSHV